MTMTHDTTAARTLAEDWTGGWNHADPERLSALFSADGTYTDLAIGRTFHGRAEIAGFRALSEALIADLHLELLNAFGDDHHVAVETVYAGHFRGAPSAFAVRGTTILRIRDGLIEDDTDNYSLATLLQQSGLPADWTPGSD
jgi:hypothetical protein